jgi:cullin 3
VFVDLCKYLNDKDLLQKYFTLDLAVRLLDKSHSSLENEKSILAKLKAEYGLSFTSNMERMFKDITLSQDICVEFENFRKPVIASKNDSKLQLSPIVASNGCWPSSVILRGFEIENTSMDFSAMALECLLPPCVDVVWNTFKSFYLGQYQGRKLTFISHLGCAEMAFFAQKTFVLQTTTNMMPILMLFNRYEKLSYSGNLSESLANTNIH